MSVEIDPPELGFQRPFNREVSQTLHLHNPTEEPLAFKVKTTAPKQYCVRPNSGRIEAGRDVEVQVLLQAMKEDPPPDAKCRDKFLVQSVPITNELGVAFSNVSAIWQNVEKTARKSIFERKIRVTFLAAESHHPTDTATAYDSPNGDHHTEDVPPSYASPSTGFGSPGQDYKSTASPVGPTFQQDGHPNEARSLADTKSSTSTPGAESVSAVSAVASNAVHNMANSAPSEDMKTQLEEARANISRLTKQLQESTLRQRKSVVSGAEKGSNPVATLQQQPVAEGVPVQIVAALCLLSFLLAYFFF
ncbi:MAG: phosphatidylinositol-binding protein scs2 [Cirrosporium novae-zelandiae]|nr:MAG: phosphatidylinositol-binding protein scs2 [Cirrosporium novae-zelandiae]